MSDRLPLIEEFAAIDTARDQARWLRQCPDVVLVERFDDLRDAVIATSEGHHLVYLWARRAVLHAVRGQDGRLPIEVECALAIASDRLGYFP